MYADRQGMPACISTENSWAGGLRRRGKQSCPRIQIVGAGVDAGEDLVARPGDDGLSDEMHACMIQRTCIAWATRDWNQNHTELRTAAVPRVWIDCGSRATRDWNLYAVSE